LCLCIGVFLDRTCTVRCSHLSRDDTAVRVSLSFVYKSNVRCLDVQPLLVGALARVGVFSDFSADIVCNL
jgi:hypothetical protein